MDATDRYAVIMYDTTTGDHQIYDVYCGRDALIGALALALNEATPTHRPIVLDVNDLIAESGITPAELAVLVENAP